MYLNSNSTLCTYYRLKRYQSLCDATNSNKTYVQLSKHSAAIEVGPGESLLIPANFKGIFEVLEPMKKHYVIIERTADQAK